MFVAATGRRPAQIFLALLISASAAWAQNSQNSDGSTSNASPANPAPQGNFFERLGKAYWNDWSPTPPPAVSGRSAADPATTTTAAPARRGYPAPLDSPPFPGSDFSVGGTPVIGAPDTQTYILMQAINGNKSSTLR